MTTGKEKSWQRPSEAGSRAGSVDRAGGRGPWVRTGRVRVRKGQPSTFSHSPHEGDGAFSLKRGNSLRSRRLTTTMGGTQTAWGPCFSYALQGLRDCAQCQGLLSHRSWAFGEKGRDPSSCRVLKLLVPSIARSR